MTRRLCSLLLCLVLVLGVSLASANVIDPALVPEKTGHITVILYGDKTPRMEALCNNEFAEVFLKEINCVVDVQFVPWSQYGSGNMTDLMIVSGESFDTTMTDSGWTDSSVSKKYVQDLKEVIYSYMPHYLDVTNPDSLKQYTYGDAIYAIPIGNKPTADTFRSVCIRQDLLEEVGMSEITSIEDLKTFATLAKEKHPDMYATMDYQLPAFILRGFGERNLSSLLTGLWIDEDSGEVVSIVDAPEFEEICKLYREWYLANLLPKDILTTQTSNNVLFESGMYMFWRGTCGTTVIENEPNLKKAVPTAYTREYFLKGEKPRYKTQYENTAFQIPVTSENAQYVALFVDLLQTKEYVDFFTYGVEGTDYEVIDGRIHTINTDELFYQWMTFNVKISTFDERFPDDFIPTYMTWDDGALPSKLIGLNIDSSSFKTTLAQIDAVWSEYAVPMTAGVVDFDENIEALRTALKSAGLDEYIAAVTAQVEAK